jgi:hypothetical protein
MSQKLELENPVLNSILLIDVEALSHMHWDGHAIL